MKKNEKFVLIVIILLFGLSLIPFLCEIYNNKNMSIYKKMIDNYGNDLELELSKHNVDINDSLSLNKLKHNNKILCDEVLINENGNVLLSKCSINHKYIYDSKTYDGYYHYGENSFYDYIVGDIVKYNNREWYVIKNSSVVDNYVTLILRDVLKYDEFNNISIPFEFYNYHGYVTIPYFKSDDCNSKNISGCSNDYNKSNIKVMLDLYMECYFDDTQLVTDLDGYKIRLPEKIWFNDIGYKDKYSSLSKDNYNLINIGYPYYTMSKVDDNPFMIYSIGNHKINVYDNSNTLIRPVINVLKNAI